jgi:hypothetical protein
MEIRRYANSRVDWGSLDELRSYSNSTITPDYTTLPQGVGLTGSYYDGAAFTTLKSKRWDPVVQYDLSTGAPALDITPTDFAVRFRRQDPLQIHRDLHDVFDPQRQRKAVDQ